MAPGVLRGRNLVFAAPTSAGKTAVYEVLALRRLITTGRPFLLVLPTVALCAQKVGMCASVCGLYVGGLRPIWSVCPGLTLSLFHLVCLPHSHGQSARFRGSEQRGSNAFFFYVSPRAMNACET
jgi:hypothetical protein